MGLQARIYGPDCGQDEKERTKMERRNFLKAVASLFPAAVAAQVVAKPSDAATKPRPARETLPKIIKKPSTLKADRYVPSTYTGGFCDCPAEKGMVVELVGFTPSIGGGQYPIVRPGSHSGQPLGILLQDVVHCNLSLEVSPELLHNDKVQVGSKVSIAQDGWVTVGQFDKPVQIGEQIYYDQAGRLTTAPTGKPIGVALSGSDADGFVKIKVQLYVNQNAELPSPH